jgi:two-component system sensor histidine kinase DctS
VSGSAQTAPPLGRRRSDGMRTGGSRRTIALWALLGVLIIAAEGALFAMTVQHRSTQMQDKVVNDAAAASARLAKLLTSDLQVALGIPAVDAGAADWERRAGAMLAEHPEMLRVERRTPDLVPAQTLDSRLHAPTFSRVTRAMVDGETEFACATSSRRLGPAYSDAYYVPLQDGTGADVMDLCLVDQGPQGARGYVVVTYSLPALLDLAAAGDAAAGNDLMLAEPDGTRVAHSSQRVGAGVYRAGTIFDLPGVTLQLQLESARHRPSLVPDLMTSFVIGLSLALIAVATTLAIDVRKRARAEAGLADALSFRKAMDDSLVTGLRARDMAGRITYANPAFCDMVGFEPHELTDTLSPPYWPPELRLAYEERRSFRAATQRRDTFETVFMRKSGERFPVMVFEAPMIGSHGDYTGWVSAVVDLTAQRKGEEMARQQQERLQATARLATAGEMASLLSHELNQPLSAIASYAAGSINMLDDRGPGAPADAELTVLMREGLAQIADHAQRAGRVIRSVHDFVRRREVTRERVGMDQLIDSVLPLISLHARKSGARVVVDLPPDIPMVVCDRAMVEQVLLNLARNGVQAMRSTAADAVLTLSARAAGPGWITVCVRDRGPGISLAVAAQLFTPFFSTRADGMGLGLSVCRTIIEQHGGTLVFENGAGSAAPGVEFRFTLPAAADAGSSA